jgi:hypothetical protein
VPPSSARSPDVGSLLSSVSTWHQTYFIVFIIKLRAMFLFTILKAKQPRMFTKRFVTLLWSSKHRNKMCSPVYSHALNKLKRIRSRGRKRLSLPASFSPWQIRPIFVLNASL